MAQRLLKGLLLNPSDTDPYKSLDDIPEEEHKPLDAILEDPHKLLDAILKHWQTPDTIAASFQSTGKSGKHTGQPAIRAVIPESQDLRPILLQYTIKQAVRRIYTENAGTANRIYCKSSHSRVNVLRPQLTERPADILMEKFEGEWHQFERGKWSKMSATWKDEGSFISDTKPTLLILESKNSNAWAKFKEEERVRRDNQNSRKTPKGLPLNRLLPSSNHESSGYK